MISCAECIERLRPDDPRVPTGPYHHSTCDYFCDKPTYYRELEANKPQVVEHIHRHSEMGKKEFDLLQQMVLKVEYLEKQLNKRKTGKSRLYTISS